MTYKPLALATAALVAGFLTFGSAQAANVMSGGGAMVGVTKSQDVNIQQASSRKKWRRWHGNGNRNWRWRNRYHGGGNGIYLGFGLLPFYQPYYQPYYAQPYYYAPARGSRHVRYCLNRYLTYHIPSNTFRGYDGDRHRCRSPYRY